MSLRWAACSSATRSIPALVTLALAAGTGLFLTWDPALSPPQPAVKVSSETSSGPTPEANESGGEYLPSDVPRVERGGSSRGGEDLAEAWLIAFLTRQNRNDNRWLPEVSRLSSPELVEELRAAGPDLVGLDGLTSWNVTRVDRMSLNDRPIDTPTRQVLAYAATVSDGMHSDQKPFVLYAFIDPDGRWRVEQVEQPYSSEG